MEEEMSEWPWRDIVCTMTVRELGLEVSFEEKGLCRAISGAGAFSSDVMAQQEGRGTDWESRSQ
jgi:hypothetical protein